MTERSLAILDKGFASFLPRSPNRNSLAVTVELLLIAALVMPSTNLHKAVAKALPCMPFLFLHLVALQGLLLL